MCPAGWKSWLFARLTSVSLLMLPIALTGMMARNVSAQTDGEPDTPNLLDGAVDIHVHSYPDDRPRSVNAMEAARLARSSGMRAIVLKNHYVSTAGLAYTVRGEVSGIEVFGGIDLNRTVGGINPAAVEHMTRVSGGWGGFVWMPTFDSENQVRFSQEDRPFVRISQDGELLPEVKEVLALVAAHDLILATGHSTAEEVLMLLREDRSQGVRRMVVTHAMNEPIFMDVAQMEDATQLGAFIEFVGSTMRTPDAPLRVDDVAEAIRRVGPEFSILSSDLGQEVNELPPEGFGAFLQAIGERGFTVEEIRRMANQNPARLLGLPD